MCFFFKPRSLKPTSEIILCILNVGTVLTGKWFSEHVYVPHVQTSDNKMHSAESQDQWTQLIPFPIAPDCCFLPPGKMKAGLSLSPELVSLTFTHGLSRATEPCWLKACFYSTSFTGNTADHTRVCVSLSCMAGCLKRLFHDALIQIKLHLVPLSALSVSFTSSSTYSSGLPFAAGLRACQLQRKAFPSSLDQCHPLSHSWGHCSLLSPTPQPYPPLHLSSSGRWIPDS